MRLHFFFFFALFALFFFPFLHLLACATGLADEPAGRASVPPTSAAIRAASVILLSKIDT